MLRKREILTGVDIAVKSPPLRGVLCVDRDILEGDGEVNKIEIEVVDAPELELMPDELVSL